VCKVARGKERNKRKARCVVELKALKKVAKELAALTSEDIATAGVTEETLVESMKEVIEEAGGAEELELSPTLKASLIEAGVIDGDEGGEDDDGMEPAEPEDNGYPKEYPDPAEMSKEDYDLLKKEYAELKEKDDHTAEDVERMKYLKEHGAAVNAFLKANKGKKKEAPAAAPEAPPAEEPEADKPVTDEEVKSLAEAMNVVLKFKEGDGLDVEGDAEALRTDVIDTIPEIEATDFIPKKGKTTFTEEQADVLRRLGCTKVPAKKAAKVVKKKIAGAAGKRGPRTNTVKTAFGHWTTSVRGRLDVAIEKGGTFKEIAEACGVTEGKVRQHIGGLRKQDGTQWPKVKIEVNGDNVIGTLG